MLQKFILAFYWGIRQNAQPSAVHDKRVMVAFIGPLAMNICKPRQARKGATVAGTSCAEMWLVEAAAISKPSPHITPLTTFCQTAFGL